MDIITLQTEAPPPHVINSSRYNLGFIISHIKHERVYVSYNTRFAPVIITIMKLAAFVA